MERSGEADRGKKDFSRKNVNDPFFIVSTKPKEPAKKLGSGDAIRAGYIFECFAYRPRNHGVDMEQQR
jgi:hypothetical protein